MNSYQVLVWSDFESDSFCPDNDKHLATPVQVGTRINISIEGGLTSSTKILKM